MKNKSIWVIDDIKYVTDIKTYLEIEKFMVRVCGISSCGFEKVLLKVGFESGRTIYLKRKGIDRFGRLVLCYSYDNKIFNDNNIIQLEYSSIVLKNDEYTRRYHVEKSYSKKNDILVINNLYERKRTYGNITYYFMIDKRKLYMVVKNDIGEGFKFTSDLTCNQSYPRYPRVECLDLEKNSDLEQYILNIDFNSSLEDVFNKLTSLTKILEFTREECFDRNVNLTYFKENKNQAEYRMRKELVPQKISIQINNDLGEVNYSHVKSRECKFGMEVCKHSIKICDGANELNFYVIDEDVNFEIANEIELRSYLLGLRYPVKIEEVIKKISEISLSDIGRYNSIYLSIFNNETCKMDKIILENGKLIEFKLNRDGRVFALDKDDNFRYENSLDENKYSIEMMGDKVIEYRYSCRNGIAQTDDSNRVMYMAIRDARESKVRVRKLLDEMIKTKEVVD